MEKKLSSIDVGKIKALRAKFPARIDVRVLRSEDGGFVAAISTFPGCNTQGDTLSELVEMVNDCVKTYLDIPQKYYSYMPTYLPPVSVAQDLDIFPISRRSHRIKMLLLSHEGARS